MTKPKVIVRKLTPMDFVSGTIPWACSSLFRGGGIGNALAMTLNTASNVMAITKAGQSTEKGLSKDVSEMLKRGSGGGSSGGGNSGRGTQ